jgi:hypothetical protein
MYYSLPRVYSTVRKPHSPLEIIRTEKFSVSALFTALSMSRTYIFFFKREKYTIKENKSLPDPYLSVW